jgi:hypothetical protein
LKAEIQRSEVSFGREIFMKSNATKFLSRQVNRRFKVNHALEVLINNRNQSMPKKVIAQRNFKISKMIQLG